VCTQSRTVFRRVFVQTVFLAALALAGGRTPFGGIARIVSVSSGETLSDLATVQLTHTPLCRAVEFNAVGLRGARLVPIGFGNAEFLAQSLQRVAASRNPIGAPLWGASIAVREGAVELRELSSASDFQAIACHPALAFGIGPYVEDGGALIASLSSPLGRPYLDAVRLSNADARAAERLLTQRKVELVLGAGPDTSGAMLFATYLVLRKDREHLKASIDATIDRADLARFFVQSPAAPLTTLLPPAAGGQMTPAPTPRPAPLGIAQSISVVFSATGAEHRAIAERLQVKLATMGYRVRLEPIDKTSLRNRWAKGEGDVLIESLLLPPASAPSLLALHALAGLGLSELPTDPSRDAAARERSLALHSLPLVPLCVQGLAVGQSPAISAFHRDPFGLPVLDDVFAFQPAP
jgi:peptide/nickel transport system substrate-binding protein